MIDFNVSQQISRLAIAFVPLMLGIICHEVAHGWVAFKLGDPTAKQQGRLTLNPLTHMDTTGTLFFVVTALFCPFVLGWAKPVPVQARYFKNPRQGMMLVALAGPLTNFLLAFLFMAGYGMALKALLSGTISPGSGTEFLIKSLAAGVSINIVLAWFNLIPLPPLDGSHILGGLLPPQLAYKYYRIARYGMLIILVLAASGLFWKLMGPLVSTTAQQMSSVLGVPRLFR